MKNSQNFLQKPPTCSQGNKPETRNARCNGDCKNVDCSHEHEQNNTSAPINTNENNNINTTCSMLSNKENNQTSSIDSRTKGVCTTPQTHSGPTGPPAQAHDDDKPAKDQTEETKTHKKINTSSDSINSSISSSSCSNKATIERQKRLKIPDWARTMSTSKTYIKIKF